MAAEAERAARLGEQADALSRRLLRELHRAQREGQEPLARCLDVALAEVNAVRAQLSARASGLFLETMARRLERLRRAHRACFPQPTSDRTVVTVFAPAAPAGEPHSLRWLDW